MGSTRELPAGHAAIGGALLTALVAAAAWRITSPTDPYVNKPWPLSDATISAARELNLHPVEKYNKPGFWNPFKFFISTDIRKTDSTRLVIDLPDVKVLQQPFYLAGIDVRNRMALLRIGTDGRGKSQWLSYGTIVPTQDCLDMVREVTGEDGPTYIFVPNGFPEHRVYIQRWAKIFPRTTLLMVPRWPKQSADSYIGSTSDLPDHLQRDIDIAMYRSALLKEAVMFHRPSGTMFTADAAVMVTDEFIPNPLILAITRLLGLHNTFGPFLRIGVSGGREFVNKLKAWAPDVRRIVTAHTTMVLDHCGDVAQLGFTKLML